MSKKTQQTSTPKRTRRMSWMRRGSLLFFKMSLFAVMFLFLLVGALWLGMNKIFNAQQISQSVTYQLQKVFDRPVVISSLDLKFLNTVELKGFAILDNEVEPGAEVISAESVLIRYQLLPLLAHKLIIDEVTLNEPHFEVVRSKEGIYNMPPIHMPQNNNGKSILKTGACATVC